MAKHFSEVKRELEQPDGHIAGIGQQLKLSEEARDARNAGRRLEDENDETDLIGTVKKLEDLIAEQRRSNERIAREMRGMVSEMKDVLEKVEELRNGAADAQHQANQMALMGVANAQQKAGEMTIKNVEEVTARSRKVIDSMVEESKRRIERLSMVTLPDCSTTANGWRLSLFSSFSCMSYGACWCRDLPVIWIDREQENFL